MQRTIRNILYIFVGVLIAISLIGCPEPNSPDSNPPANPVILTVAEQNSVLLVNIENPNNEMIQVQITLNSASDPLTNVRLEVDGESVSLSEDINILLDPAGGSNAIRQIRIIGLVNDTEYTFTATTSDESGNRHSRVITITLRLTLNAPANLEAVPGDRQVTLSWDSVVGATSYNIYRDGAATAIDTVNAPTTTYIDTGLTDDTRYTYTVTAVNIIRESDPSNEAFATPPLPSTPEAPANFDANSGDMQVFLSWNSVVGATSYNIYRDGAATAIDTVNAPTTTYTDTGLTNDTRYTYTVTAVNRVDDESVHSFEESATPLPPRPGIPANLSIENGNMQITLRWNLVNRATSYNIYRDGAATAIDTVNAPTTTYTDTGLTNDARYTYTVTAVNIAGESDPSNEAFAIPMDVDTDNDLLIDIRFLEQLNNIRHDLDGTHYRDGDTIVVQCGATGTIECIGYELMNDLDFDLTTSYASGTVNNDWRPTGGNPNSANNQGWIPIGGNFAAIFEGNGNTISDLYARDVSRSDRIGLFSGITTGAVIRGLGVLNGNLYGDSGDDYIGGLVGEQVGGIITSSYTTGYVDGGDGNNDSVGGLVGRQSTGAIVASYATGDADGGSGNNDNVGGLVGVVNGNGDIIASYASGNTNGGPGVGDIGGLVGSLIRGDVIASYATGNSIGGSDGDNVGGLVGALGRVSGARILSSYATGNSDGKGASRGGDYTGGLVGEQSGGEVVSSYAIGNSQSSGSSSRNPHYFGKLVGRLQPNGTVTESYGFGRITGSGITTRPPVDLPTNVDSADELTAMNAGNNWDASIWNFGTTSQRPILKYADYDGSGSKYACANNANPPTGAILIPECGTDLPGPGQTR